MMNRKRPLPSRRFLPRYRCGMNFFKGGIGSLFSEAYLYQECPGGELKTKYSRSKRVSWFRRLEVSLVNLIHAICPLVDVDEAQPFYFSRLRYRKNWAKETFWFLAPIRGRGRVTNP